MCKNKIFINLSSPPSLSKIKILQLPSNRPLPFPLLNILSPIPIILTATYADVELYSTVCRRSKAKGDIYTIKVI